MSHDLLIEWDPSSKEWKANLALTSARSVGISFSPESPEHIIRSSDGDLPREIRQAMESDAALILARSDEIRGLVAEMLFDGWKAHWYDGEFDTIATLPEFANALVLESANIYAEEIELIYSDGDLFGGHYILVTVDRTGKILRKPNIAG